MMLPVILGEKIDKLPMELEVIGDLIYYEWPLLTVLHGDDGETYIETWADTNFPVNTIERTLIFRTAKATVLQYVVREIPLMDLFTTALSEFYVVDRDFSKNTKTATFTDLEGIKDYLPPDPTVLFETFDVKSLEPIMNYLNL